MVVIPHSTGAADAYDHSTAAAAITPAAWRGGAAADNAAALAASVITASAPNTGHGGVAQRGDCTANAMNSCPARPRNRPLRNPVGPPARTGRRETAHAWP